VFVCFFGFSFSDCTVSDLTSIAAPDGRDQRCAGRQSLPISNGVVCYNGNTSTTQSEAEYVCDSNFFLSGGSTRVCQRNGYWTGSIPQCSKLV